MQGNLLFIFPFHFLVTFDFQFSQFPFICLRQINVSSFLRSMNEWRSSKFTAKIFWFSVSSKSEDFSRNRTEENCHNVVDDDDNEQTIKISMNFAMDIRPMATMASANRRCYKTRWKYICIQRATRKKEKQFYKNSMWKSCSERTMKIMLIKCLTTGQYNVCAPSTRLKARRNRRQNNRCFH